MNFVRRLSVCAQPPIIPLHGAWACRRHILTSHLGAWASSKAGSGKRIFLNKCLSLSKAHYFYCIKSVYSIEHLWCSFENSKTPSFHKISVNFVILKQIQKIHTQWLRQAQPPIISLHGAWACRRHILTSHLGAWACRRHIISIVLKSVHSIEHL